MFDRRDFAIGIVRIDRNLRRRRTARRKHRRNDEHHDDTGNLDVVRNLGDVGSVDNLRNAGHVGLVGNVRLRLEQHYGVVESNGIDSNGDNVAVRHDGRQRSNRSAVGILRDRQSWGQSLIDAADDDRIAHNGQRGEFSAVGADGARCFSSGDEQHPLNNFSFERERP
jgi:hypothetical protein